MQLGRNISGVNIYVLISFSLFYIVGKRTTTVNILTLDSENVAAAPEPALSNSKPINSRYFDLVRFIVSGVGEQKKERVNWEMM